MLSVALYVQYIEHKASLFFMHTALISFPLKHVLIGGTSFPFYQTRQGPQRARRAVGLELTSEASGGHTLPTHNYY